MAESYFAEAKFLEEDTMPREPVLAAIYSIREGSVKNAKETRAPLENGGDGNIKPQQH